MFTDEKKFELFGNSLRQSDCVLPTVKHGGGGGGISTGLQALK